MATLAFSALGAGLGSQFLGASLGASLGGVIGRSVGGILGREIDMRLFGSGSPRVNRPDPIEYLRITTAHVGTPVPESYGRTKLAGQIIWATDFKAVAEEGGYRYFVSFALALGRGEISRIGRVWFGDEEVLLESIDYRVYSGNYTQEPDPLIETLEGYGYAPAYRGIAYIVFENLDLTRFGNRIPSLLFEVFRHPQNRPIPDMRDDIKALAIIPGTGEYALATTPVHENISNGVGRALNQARGGDKTDFAHALGNLVADCPNARHASLIVSWFGNDLRAAHCAIYPAVESREVDGDMPWRVCSTTRADARILSRENDAPVYGGTPADAAVVEGIRATKSKGIALTFYPFIMMDIPTNNTLPDPYQLGQLGQLYNPWRGRITAEIEAPQSGHNYGTDAIQDEIKVFVGKARAENFSILGQNVVYSGDPTDWGYRRFILHYAMLCKLAGGVDCFLIGSELRGLTSLRGSGKSFPFVDELCILATEVRQILGPHTKISYAADWSEYFGTQPWWEGSRYFHLDPLWAHKDIDFVGIDNYMPLSDWRHTRPHHDEAYVSVYDLDYLKTNIEGGEGYDWYYASAQDRDQQIRTPITDWWQENWVWRYKDLRNWWQNRHHDRPLGNRENTPTAWVPQSKPIVFTEYGCGAMDLGTNEPNRFFVPNSSESAYPYGSTGRQDSFIQAQYIRAINDYWADPVHNPRSTRYDGSMIDLERAAIWAFDARPWPDFPARHDLWADHIAYSKGHWVSSRILAPRLANVIADICAQAGIYEIDVSRVDGLLLGVSFRGNESPREMLEILMRGFFFHVFERDGVLVFENVEYKKIKELDSRYLIQNKDGGLIEIERNPIPKTPNILELGFVDADGGYMRDGVVVRFGDAIHGMRTNLDLPLCLSWTQAQELAQIALLQTKNGANRVRFQVSRHGQKLELGDLIRPFEGAEIYRIDRMNLGLVREVEAFHTVVHTPHPYDSVELNMSEQTGVRPLWAFGFRAPSNPSGITIAATARPWGGAVSILGAGAYLASIDTPAVMGTLGLSIRADSSEIVVTLVQGALWAASFGHKLLIGVNSDLGIEVISYREVTLIAPYQYRLSGIMRGLDGTLARPHLENAVIVAPDESLGFLSDALIARKHLTSIELVPDRAPSKRLHLDLFGI